LDVARSCFFRVTCGVKFTPAGCRSSGHADSVRDCGDEDVGMI
jgi:hypothetical protein